MNLLKLSLSVIALALTTFEASADSFTLTETYTADSSAPFTAVVNFNGTVEHNQYIDNISNVTISFNSQLAEAASIVSYNSSWSAVDGGAIVGLTNFNNLSNFEFYVGGTASTSNTYVSNIAGMDNTLSPNSTLADDLIQSDSGTYASYYQSTHNWDSGSITVNNQSLTFTGYTYSVVDNTSSVPEPEQWAMLLLGLPLISSILRRKQTMAAA